jgi:hypothetical protein
MPVFYLAFVLFFRVNKPGPKPSIGTLPMPSGQEATRSIAGKKSLQRLVAEILLCGLLLWPQAAYCKEASVQEQILSFPKAYSAGSLYRLKRRHGTGTYYGFSHTFFGQAQGDVVVPRGLDLGLTLSYQAGQDLTFLDRLPPGVVIFLKMERLSITDQQFKALKCLPDIKGLELTDVDITDRGIVQVQRCHDLIYAALKSTVITGKGLAAFRNVKSLTHLDCEQDMFDDASMSNLSGLTNLDYLRLKNVRITDAGLKHLLPLTNIVELTLSINKITDAGVATLLPLKKLRVLDITDTKVTMACIDTLTKFPDLAELSISRLDFTPAQMAEVQRRLPHCRIIDGKKIGADLQFFAPLH